MNGNNEIEKKEEKIEEKKEEKKGIPLKYAVFGFILIVVALAVAIAFYDVYKDKGDMKALEEATARHVQILNNRDSEAYWDLLTTKSKSLLEKTHIEQFMSSLGDANAIYEIQGIDNSGITLDPRKNEASVRGIVKVTNNGIMILDLSKVLNLTFTNLTMTKSEQGLLFTHDVVSDKGSRGQLIVIFAPSEETSILEQRLTGIDPRSIGITFTSFQNGLLITYKIPSNMVLTVFTPSAAMDTPSFYMYLQKETGRETIIPKTKKCQTYHVRTLPFYELWRKEEGVWKYVEKAAELPQIPQTSPPPKLAPN